MKIVKKLNLSLILMIILFSFNVLVFGIASANNFASESNYSQNQSKSYWNRSYGGSSYEWTKSIINTNNGGYVFTGSTTSKGSGLSDLWLVKISPEGIVEWETTYGSSNDEWANDVIQTKDGGFILTGVAFSFSRRNADLWVLKTDTLGNIEWDTTYGGIGDDKGNTIIESADGGYLIAGVTTSYGRSEKNGWLLKIDSNGQPTWNQTFGGNKIDWFNSLVELEDGYMITGLTHSFGSGGSDMWLVRTDLLGNVMWTRTYGGTRDESSTSIVESSAGNYYLSGFTRSYGTYFSRDGWVIKVNSNGDMIWNRSFGGMGYDSFFASLLSEQDDLIVAGTSGSFGEGGLDMWIGKITAEGDLLWQETLGLHSQLEVAYSVIQTGKHEYTLAGTTAILANKSQELSGSIPEHWNYVDQRDVLLMKMSEPSDFTTNYSAVSIIVVLSFLSIIFKRWSRN
jgi:hypothetical protein